MLTVHKMPLKNQFLTGIGFMYDKTPQQNELKPFTSFSFTGDCTVDFLGKESLRRMISTFTGTGIVYNAMLKADVEMIPFNGDFYPIRFDFEIGTVKSDKFMKIFAKY
jgi:hypothetical protein